MSKPRMGVCIQTGVVVSLLVGLTGCQQFNNLIGRNNSTVAAARKEPAKEKWSAKVKPSQEIDVQLAMAQTMESQGNIDGAIKAYQAIAAKSPKNAMAQHRLAVLHDKKGDCKQSEKHYLAALKYAPKNADLHCDYGYSLYLQRRWKDSEKSYRRAIELNPNLARAHTNLGLLLARTDRRDDAYEEFRRAGCSEPDIHANLAFAMVLEEKWDDAKVQYQIALAKDPKSKAAQEGLRSLERLAAKTGKPESELSRDTRPGSRQVSHSEPIGSATPRR